MTRGRPKTSPKTYARDKRLTDKYPGIPERPAALRQEGPRNNREQQEWDGWIARAILAFRTQCERRAACVGPYEVPVIAEAELIGAVLSQEW